MKKLVALGLLLAGFVTQASAGFVGAYAPANWTQFAGDGSVNVFTDSDLSITSGNAGAESFTDVAIVVPFTGLISFDWTYTTNDDPFFDLFGVSTATPGFLFTAISDTSGATTQSGTFSLFVTAGDLFAFTAWSIDGGGGSATARITNFRESHSSA